jgi:uncharacterized protein YcfL
MPVSTSSRKSVAEEINMRTFITLLFTSSLLLACSPTDQTPKIAEDQREVLNQAEKAAAALEQSAVQKQQDIDE